MVKKFQMEFQFHYGMTKVSLILIVFLPSKKNYDNIAVGV
jgi:hypothetical protein